jgi:hypothetical protein
MPRQKKKRKFFSIYCRSIFEVSQAPSICLSGKTNVTMKMCTAQWWNSLSWALSKGGAISGLYCILESRNKLVQQHTRNVRRKES